MPVAVYIYIVYWLLLWALRSGADWRCWPFGSAMATTHTGTSRWPRAHTWSAFPGACMSPGAGGAPPRGRGWGGGGWHAPLHAALISRFSGIQVALFGGLLGHRDRRSEGRGVPSRCPICFLKIGTRRPAGGPPGGDGAAGAWGGRRRAARGSLAQPPSPFSPSGRRRRLGRVLESTSSHTLTLGPIGEWQQRQTRRCSTKRARTSASPRKTETRFLTRSGIESGRLLSDPTSHMSSDRRPHGSPACAGQLSSVFSCACHVSPLFKIRASDVTCPGSSPESL